MSKQNIILAMIALGLGAFGIYSLGCRDADTSQHADHGGLVLTGQIRSSLPDIDTPNGHIVLEIREEPSSYLWEAPRTRRHNL